MTETTRNILCRYFHDSVFTDAHYDRDGATLTLSLQCEREMDEHHDDWRDAAYTYRLIFEGVRRQMLETECGGSWTDVQFLTGEFLPTPDGLWYAMHLHRGYAEIVCCDIRVERADGGAIPVVCPPSPSIQPPLTPTERNRLLTALQYGGSLSVMQMLRLRRTLEEMERTADPELAEVLRRILVMERGILLAVTSRMIAEVGEAQDLPLLYAHLPKTAERPDLRRALLYAIDRLARRTRPMGNHES